METVGTERRALLPISQHALVDAQRQAQELVSNVVMLAAQSEGINPAEGWHLDPAAMEWVREVPMTDE